MKMFGSYFLLNVIILILYNVGKVRSWDWKCSFCSYSADLLIRNGELSWQLNFLWRQVNHKSDRSEILWQFVSQRKWNIKLFWKFVNRYSKWNENQEYALELVIDACYYLDIYPRPVCQGMVNNVGARLFKIIKLSNVIINSPNNLLSTQSIIFIAVLSYWEYLDVYSWQSNAQLRCFVLILRAVDADRPIRSLSTLK